MRNVGGALVPTDGRHYDVIENGDWDSQITQQGE